MIRYRVEDVLKDLPELTRKIVEVEAAPTAGLEDAFEAYLSGSKADPTAKARSALVKAPMTVEYCQTLQEGGSGPLLVFTDHVESAKLLADRLGVRPITGASPMHERMATVERFQTGRIPAVVATIGALSVGVTLTAARHVVFNDLSWVPSDNAQAEKRIHRIGQKNACFAHYIESTPTDAYIRKTLLEKSESISKVIS
jgi:SNF2 family DNA or RNA helicase